MIPAYDRIAAVVERPAVAGGREGEGRLGYCAAVFVRVGGIINIVACCIRVVVRDFCRTADYGHAAAVVQAAAISGGVVLLSRAALHIQLAFRQDFDAVQVAGGQEIRAILNRDIAVPVVRAGVDTQTCSLVARKRYLCARSNRALCRQNCAASSVVACVQSRGAVHRQTIRENAPTTAIIVISNKIGTIRNRHTAVIASKATAIACISTLRNINLRVIINQNVDWIDSHTVPVAVSDSD